MKFTTLKMYEALQLEFRQQKNEIFSRMCFPEFTVKILQQSFLLCLGSLITIYKLSKSILVTETQIHLSIDVGMVLGIEVNWTFQQL